MKQVFPMPDYFANVDASQNELMQKEKEDEAEFKTPKFSPSSLLQKGTPKTPEENEDALEKTTTDRLQKAFHRDKQEQDILKEKDEEMMDGKNFYDDPWAPSSLLQTEHG